MVFGGQTKASVWSLQAQSKTGKKIYHKTIILSTHNLGVWKTVKTCVYKPKTDLWEKN